MKTIDDKILYYESMIRVEMMRTRQRVGELYLIEKELLRLYLQKMSPAIRVMYDSYIVYNHCRQGGWWVGGPIINENIR